ncbi:MAG: DNA methyltransferase, partial [Nitrospirae bacterium]|nr:DNA methyltransferase [Nitrospirota bacterium]
NHAFITDSIIESRVTLSNKGIGFVFPLYLYKQKEKPKKKSFSSVMLLFEPQAEYDVKRPNLSPALIEALSESFKKKPDLEQIFYYIYAVFYSNIYRTKYAEFLKIDFPRIPFTRDYKLFSRLAGYGEKLVELHLFKSAELDKHAVRFQGKGDNRVEKLKYEQGRLYINKEQYFEFIEPEIWSYQIGGYHVCEKWLKDRKDRILSLDDIKHYLKVVVAIEKTVEIQNEIDRIYPQVEENIIEFKNK